MLHTLKDFSLRAGSLLAILALSACGNLSQVTGQGTTDKPVWPDPAHASFTNGSYPNLDSLRLVGNGMTKDQIYSLLGRPHFSEGFAGVREWDYLFHFRTSNGDETCQYKILYDKDMLARSFLWKPAACADVLNGQKPAAPATFALSSDVLFGFDSAVLTTKGRVAVDRIANQLRQRNDASVTVVGYTDRLGSEPYNQALSQRRADTVRLTLVNDGVEPGRVSAVGKGESAPLVQCNNGKQSELIACLAPNRRVEIVASGSH
ncbi:OmpA family protein [Candidimonas humi]|uniref:OmpA family protein n=1 Tax=Candidimonas humi TaxID=683355 RepID=A0ABV8P5M6_9BURK|nr:OmpA family protein [Candidimonas humi]MBV6307312.1 OmpA family protein [Candidimonas humi]